MVRLDILVKAMLEAMVYFHSLAGEPFGISTVEAMSAGLIPVVPDIGGHTEFVPLKCQFHTCGEGVKAIAISIKCITFWKSFNQRFSKEIFCTKLRQAFPTNCKDVVIQCKDLIEIEREASYCAVFFSIILFSSRVLSQFMI